MGNYWTRRSVSRRAALRGAGVGLAGLAGAALIGCGGSDEESTPAPAGTTAASSGGGAAATGTAAAAGAAAMPERAGIPHVAGDPKPGGTYTVSTTSTYKQHDMHTALGPTVWHVIGEKALEIHPETGEILPHIVGSYEVIDAGGLELTLHVAPGIKIHDVAPWSGREFTAEDVAWNMNRMIGSTAEAEGIPQSSFQRASMLEGMDRAEAVDDRTVKVTMARPNSAFFNGLTENRMPMMPREMSDVGYDDPLKMAGVGGFSMDEFVDGEKMTFKKFPNYFRPNEPYFDKFEMLVIPDRSSAMTAFISGQIQSIGSLQNHELKTLESAKPDANYYTWVDSNWMHFRPNMSYEPFTDFRVRKAMMLATDHAALGDGYWGSGWGYQAALHPGYPEGWKSDKVKTLPGYNPETKEADRAEAVKMMAAAGYADGAGIEFETLYVEVIGDTKENAIRFQEQMTQIFPAMKVTVKGYPDLASYSKPQAEGDFRGVSYIITATPDIVLEAISQFHTNGSRNYGKFSEPALDDVLDRAQAELDTNARTQLMDEFQTKFMNEWQPLIIFYARPARNMFQGNIGGYDTTAGTWYGYSGLTKVPRWYYVS